ncbi:MAG TPA: glycoside hydrolase family 16 protein, partial [Pontiella sp.]|nr:glycoside hydrolase family 16 protein [Pontiella sp.]
MTGNNKKSARRVSPWPMCFMIALFTTTCMVTTAQNWDLVWSDEFDGPDIDTSKWSHEVNGWGGGNNELQYYTARTNNSFIENGKLVIQALEETYTGPDGTRDYTSARLRTLNKGDWTYGRFEARMKLPYGQGLWPAFWMLPTDWVYGGWAASGEIDIMEIVGHQPNILHGTIHYHGEWPDNWYSGGSYTLPTGDFSDDFHVFAVEWEYGEIRWYVDGIHYHTETWWDSTSAPYPAPFDERFHILLNVAVGGNWPGSPDGTTVFHQRMEVDYVRVYSTTNIPPPST